MPAVRRGIYAVHAGGQDCYRVHPVFQGREMRSDVYAVGQAADDCRSVPEGGQVGYDLPALPQTVRSGLPGADDGYCPGRIEAACAFIEEDDGCVGALSEASGIFLVPDVDDAYAAGPGPPDFLVGCFQRPGVGQGIAVVPVVPQQVPQFLPRQLKDLAG